MPGTVTVASKLPFPLKLQLQQSYEVTEEVFGGGVRKKTRWQKVGKEVVIQGCSYDRGKPHEKQIVGGAALTHGVDADFWNAWLEQHKTYSPVVNGLIFAQAKPADAISEAKEMAELKSGFEPTDPNDMPDEFKAAVKAA